MTHVIHDQSESINRARTAHYTAQLEGIRRAIDIRSRTPYTPDIDARVRYHELDGAVSGGFAGAAIGLAIALIQLASGSFSYYPQLPYFDSGILHNILLMTVIGAMIGSILGGLENAIRGFEDAKTRYAIRKPN